MTTNFYSASAEGYDELYGEEQLKKLDFIKNILKENKIEIKKNILDIGCGSGIATKYFNCATGIDPCKELLEIAKQKLPLIKFIEASAENIPFNKDEFYYSISLTAAQNFSDMTKAITEINRVSKKGFLITILKNSIKKEELRKNIKNIKNVKIIETEDEKDAIFILLKSSK